MNITVNKRTARAIKKAVYFTLVGCFKREGNELNKESIKIIGLTENEVIELCKFHTRLHKTETQKNKQKL
jgi:hypothetical protein